MNLYKNLEGSASENKFQRLSTSRPKSLMTNAAWNVISTLWQTAVSFFYTPFLINRIGSDFYGLFILLMSVAGLLGIMNLGLGEATLRYVAYYSGRNDLLGVNRVVRATLTIYLLIGVLVGTAFYFASPRLVTILAIPAKDNALGASLLRLTAFSFSLGLVGRALGTIPNALQRYDISTKLIITESIFQVSGIVILILSGYGIFELVLWGIATALFMLLVNLFVAKRLIPKLIIRPTFAIEGMREIFSYGIFAFITQVLGILWGQADRILLGTLVSSSSVAYLTVPQNLAFRASYAVNSAGGVLFPRFSSTQERSEIEGLFLDSTWILLCISIIIFVPMTVLIPDFLRLWISAEFSAKSAWVGQVIACSCMIRGAFAPYDSMFKGLGKPQYLTYLYLCTGLTSLVANFLLIPRFGLAGAGYCYCLTPLWGFLAILVAWNKVLSKDGLRPLVRVVITPILLGFTALTLCYLIRSQAAPLGWAGLLMHGALFLLLTASMVFGVEYILAGKSSRTQLVFSLIQRFYLKVIGRLLHEQ